MARHNLRTACECENYITNYALFQAVTNMAPPRESSDFAAVLDACQLENRAGTCRDTVTTALAKNQYETVSAAYLINQFRVADPDLLERPCCQGSDCVAVKCNGLSKPLMQYQSQIVQAQLARYLALLKANKREPDVNKVSQIYGRASKCVVCIMLEVQLVYLRRVFDYAWKTGTTVNDDFPIPEHFQVFCVAGDLPGEYKLKYCIPAPPTLSVNGKQVTTPVGPSPMYNPQNYVKGLRRCVITGKYYEGLLQKDELICKPNFPSGSVLDAQGYALTGFH
jgi:hypothetical protein